MIVYTECFTGYHLWTRLLKDSFHIVCQGVLEIQVTHVLLGNRIIDGGFYGIVCKFLHTTHCDCV